MPNTDVQNKAIIEIISKIDTFDVKITVSGFPELYPCRPHKGAIKCQAGTNTFYVTYQGDIYPCASTKSKSNNLIGNIFDLDKVTSYLELNKKVKFHEACLNPVKINK